MTYYCTECGRKMRVVSSNPYIKFERSTGKKVTKTLTVYQCPLFVSYIDSEFKNSHDTLEVIE